MAQYGKTYFFQQTGFSKVTITSTGIGIGTETPTFPLHIIFSIYCSCAVCASEFNAISDQRIKTNIENLDMRYK